MDKSWLMDPKTMAMVKSMRTYIKSEFGASLSLTDDALYQQLCHYAEQSRNERLHKLRAQLDEAVQPPDPEPASDRSSHVYRGQVMTPPERPAPTEPDNPKAHKRPKRERVYRGQRIAD